MQRVLLATWNSGKIREFQSVFNDCPFEFISLQSAGIDTEVEETGLTFQENAILKAGTYSALSGMIALAEDSGLEVTALQGEPGVYSSRFAGSDKSDNEKNILILNRLQGIPWEDRTAQYRSVIAMASPTGRLQLTEGIVQGMIVFEPKGARGFGYDPIFYLPHLEKTAAELSINEKNLISHRGKAARLAKELLTAMVAQDEATHGTKDPGGSC